MKNITPQMQIIPTVLRLRKVCQADCQSLFAWANDPEVRQRSIHTSSISWDTHVAWFAHKQEDSNCLHFIAESVEGLPVGQIRFDIRTVETEQQEAEISLSLDVNQRGKGYGVLLITEGMTALFQSAPVRWAHAWVQPDNLPSQRAFLRAGFSFIGLEIKGGLVLHHYCIDSIHPYA